MLFFIVFIVYLLNSLDILSPSIISISMYIFSVFFIILNANYWNETISFKAASIIIVGIIAFALAEILSMFIFRSQGSFRHNITVNRINNYKMLETPIRIILLFVAFGIIVEFVYYRYISELAMFGGYGINGRSMLSCARLAMLDTSIHITPSWFLKLGKALVKGFAFITVYMMIYNHVFAKVRKIQYRYILPNIVYSFQAVFSTGRTEIIYYIVYILMILFIMWKIANNWSRKLDMKIIKFGVGGIFIFLICFRLLGYLTGKSDYLSLWDNLSIYIGSPIIALSKYLDINITNTIFGEETLGSIYGVLRYIGFDLPLIYVPLEPVIWDNVQTNIYTSLRRYIQDYSVIGMIIIQFSLGLLYGSWFNWIKKHRHIGFSLIVFARLFYPIVESVIEERFFNVVLTTGTLYDLVMLYILYKLLIKKNIGKINNVESIVKKTVKYT